jgi:hypothetical protein
MENSTNKTNTVDCGTTRLKTESERTCNLLAMHTLFSGKLIYTQVSDNIKQIIRIYVRKLSERIWTGIIF